MRFITSVFFIFCFSLFGFAQVNKISFSNHLIFSDINTGPLYNFFEFEKLNSWKYSRSSSVGIDIGLWQFINLKTSLSYNERKALEVFNFGFTEETERIQGTGYVYTFGNIPTSPQSKDFYNDHTEYIHFPNFKYLHLEVLPFVSFGKKWKYELGVGIVGGYLLNQEQVTFDKAYFPWAAPVFEPPLSVSGTIRYHKYDAAWVSYLGVSYPIKDKWHIGLSARFQDSFLRFNESFRDDDLSLIKWRVFTTGLELKYVFSR